MEISNKIKIFKTLLDCLWIKRNIKSVYFGDLVNILQGILKTTKDDFIDNQFKIFDRFINILLDKPRITKKDLQEALKILSKNKFNIYEFCDNGNGK